MKAQKKQASKERHKAERQRRFDLKQQKRRAKHRGH
ncbi:MAG: YjdF family protein [Acutalibacter sp.]|nr:YjdF family protein [Acutalibacter sp.]